MSNEPRKLADIIAQSEAFKASAEKWQARKNFTPHVEKSESEKEYVKKVFSEAPAAPKVTEADAARLFWYYANQAVPGYKIENKELYRQLVNYFFGFDSKYDPTKGMLLAGATGSGKTVFIKAIRLALQHVGASFRMINCIDVEQSVRFGDGYEGYDSGRLCFDDLGAEQYETLYMGNRIVVMAEVLQIRYNQWQDHSKKTFITSNLLPEDIGKRYGTRVQDRLNEMCNLEVFDWGSFR